MSLNAQRVQLGPFFDGSDLCGAAQLFHYQAGTTTTQDIWSSRGKEALAVLPQPLLSDANGIFDFFADGLYKIVIKKADGTVIKTLDNWKFIDLSETTFSEGEGVDTASTINVGSSVWAPWNGSVDVSTIIGDSPFYWAVASGNFNLINSSTLIVPDGRNRKVLSGDILFFLNDGNGVWRLGGQFQTEGGWTGRQGAAAVASATLAVPTDGDFIDMSGGTTITAVAAAKAGLRFRVRFTGTGLNIIHNATSLIAPFRHDYRTVPNEIIEFLSLGSGNWIFYSINGPRERLGISYEWNGPSLPDGFLFEDGSSVSRTTYSGLFQEIGTTFGAVDGTTFNLPDSRGRHTLTIDGSANRVTSASLGGSNADTIGGTGGEQTHTLVISEMPSHAHSLAFQAVGTAAGGGAAGSYGNGTNTGSTGGDGAHNNMAPFIVKQKIIRF